MAYVIIEIIRTDWKKKKGFCDIYIYYYKSQEYIQGGRSWNILKYRLLLFKNTKTLVIYLTDNIL